MLESRDNYLALTRTILVSISDRGKWFFCLTKLSDLLWDPHGLKFNWYRGLFPREQNGRNLRLITNLYIMRALIISVARPSHTICLYAVNWFGDVRRTCKQVHKVPVNGVRNVPQDTVLCCWSHVRADCYHRCVVPRFWPSLSPASWWQLLVSRISATVSLWTALGWTRGSALGNFFRKTQVLADVVRHVWWSWVS